MSEEPATCVAAVFVGANRPLDLRCVAVPRPADGEALVRVECCTMCGSDLHTITGARTEPTPSILGHEILGTVVEVGPSPPDDIVGEPLGPGDRVTWSVCVACGTCDRCSGGLPQKCRSLFKYGHSICEGRAALSGGLAEYILLQPGTAVVKLDFDVPDEVLCPANCATATIAAAYRTAGAVAGRRILVLGAGMLGLTATAFAKTQGAEHVTVCDPDRDRLAAARRFGANGTIVWSDGDVPQEQFDVVLELSGSLQAVEAACRAVDVGGRVILVGSVLPSPPVQLDPQALVRRCLTVKGVHNYAPQDLQTGVAFLSEFHNRFPFTELVSHTWPLCEVNEAIEAALRERPVRIAIRPLTDPIPTNDFSPA